MALSGKANTAISLERVRYERIIARRIFADSANLMHQGVIACSRFRLFNGLTAVGRTI